MGLFSKSKSKRDPPVQSYRPPLVPPSCGPPNGPPPGHHSEQHDEHHRHDNDDVPPPPFQEFAPEAELPTANLPIYTQPSPPPRYLVEAQSLVDPIYSGAPEVEVKLGDQYCDAYPIFPVREVGDACTLNNDNEIDLVALRAKNLVLGYGFVPPRCTLDPRLHGPARFGVNGNNNHSKRSRLLPQSIIGGRSGGVGGDSEGQVRNDFVNGTAYIRSSKRTKDTTLTTDFPLFSPAIFNLLNTQMSSVNMGINNDDARANNDGRPYDLLYYEITITKLGQRSQDASIAIGFTCQPYPPFRLPGWHRGSIAVHSDDGCRYCNDSMGGKPLVEPFVVGHTVGLGLDLAKQVVFITKNGKMQSGWNLWDDKNQRPMDEARGFRDALVVGIDGSAEIYPAIGVYGEVGAVVNFGGQVPFKCRYSC